MKYLMKLSVALVLVVVGGCGRQPAAEPEEAIATRESVSVSGTPAQEAVAAAGSRFRALTLHISTGAIEILAGTCRRLNVGYVFADTHEDAESEWAHRISLSDDAGGKFFLGPDCTGGEISSVLIGAGEERIIHYRSPVSGRRVTITAWENEPRPELVLADKLRLVLSNSLVGGSWVRIEPGRPVESFTFFADGRFLFHAHLPPQPPRFQTGRFFLRRNTLVLVRDSLPYEDPLPIVILGPDDIQLTERGLPYSFISNFHREPVDTVP